MLEDPTAAEATFPLEWNLFSAVDSEGREVFRDLFLLPFIFFVGVVIVCEKVMTD